MTSSFAIATNNPVLSKSEQLETWLRFSALLEALKSVGLEFNKNDLETYKAQANKQQLKALKVALEARDTLVFTNQALVIKLAEQYSNEVISQSELIQVGNYGLMKALVKFKPKKNAKFSSYAYFWVKAVIFEALYRVDPIYIPQKVQREMEKFNFVAVEEEDRVKELSNSDRVTASTVNEIMANLSDHEQEILSDAFGLDGNTTLLTVALFQGISFEEALAKVEALLTRIRDNAA
ncbi:sigma-70 family RNA polymerase sigma factor [Myxosarcina sp. GI1(2024)]